jgi:hypothetical protein
LPDAWKVAAAASGDRFTLTVDTGSAAKQATFFPLEPAQIDNATPQELTQSERGFRLVLPRSNLLRGPLKQLRGVLVLPGDGAYMIDAPVEAG